MLKSKKIPKLLHHIRMGESVCAGKSKWKKKTKNYVWFDTESEERKEKKKRDKRKDERRKSERREKMKEGERMK